MPRLPADTAAFPPQEQTFETKSSYTPNASKGRLFTDIYSETYHSNESRPTSESYEYALRFATPEQMAPEDATSLVLPDIGPYLPERTDPDTAGALTALYRTHCVSLIDAVRFCKEKQFFRLFASFHGTLTVPVQKLFAQPEVQPWIRECDWMMYQKMIRNLSQLTLQVAPPPVLRFLDNVEKQLRPHLCKVFSNLPIHVLEARLEPATLFAHLLRQMLRVNSTAHAAAVMLMSDQNRHDMWHDWKSYIFLKRIIESELPHSCDHEEVYNILDQEIRLMLLPLKSEMWVSEAGYFQENVEVHGDVSNETVIDRIAAFLTKLPSRFPHASARTILHCVNALGSAALREITVQNGTSFQGWWLTKVFIDEMGQWLASLGGFLAHSPPNFNSPNYSPVMGESVINEGSGSNNDSRYSSIDAGNFGAPSPQHQNSQSFVANGHLNAAVQQPPAAVAAAVQSAESQYAPHQHQSSQHLPHQRPSPQHLPPHAMSTSGHGLLTNASLAAGSSQQFPANPGYESMSFNVELDLATSQQEPSPDDSGIALLDGDVEAKYAHGSVHGSQGSVHHGQHGGSMHGGMHGGGHQLGQLSQMSQMSQQYSSQMSQGMAVGMN